MVKKVILIVEDDEDTLFMLEKRLGSQGYRCYGVTSVEQALASLSEVNPDLVLLDLMFRGKDGTAFLDSLKKDQKSPPVLIVSGCNDKDIVEYVLDHGAAGFIRKPIEASQLVSMVNEYIT